MLVRPSVLSSVCKLRARTDRVRAAVKQVCENSTLTIRQYATTFPDPVGYFPDISKKFPDATRREFGWKPLNLLACPALENHGNRRFPQNSLFFSLLAGNLRLET